MTHLRLDDPPIGRQCRFEVVPEESAILVEARSSMGRIEFGSTALSGHVDAWIDDGGGGVTWLAHATLQLPVATLRSGNTLYDAELLRRIDARRYPTTTLELTEAVRLDGDDRFDVTGTMTWHSMTRTMHGVVTVARPDAATLVATGEHTYDIRDFNVSAPTVLMFRIYPDVRVRLHLTATTMTTGPAQGRG